VTVPQNPEPFPDHAGDIGRALESSLRLPELKAVVGETAGRCLEETRLDGCRRILMGGSGDSLFAARCTAPALRRWTGIPVEARTAMELARYDVPLLRPNDAVIGISNSGSSSRARECVGLAKAKGALALGVTGSLEGPLAHVAERVVHRPIHPATGMPERYARCFVNFAEFVAVLLGIYTLGIGLGRKVGRLDAAQAASLHGAMEAAIAALPATAAAIDGATRALARELHGIDTIWAIGAGPGRGIADYCAAKFHEQMPINGIGQDLEEWAHLEYFLTLAWGRRSVVFVIAPPGNSLDRAEELVEGIAGAGGLPLVVTAQGRGRFDKAYARFDMPADTDEFFAPFLYHLPAQLLVLYMAHLAGIRDLPMRRHDGTWLIAKGLVLDSPAGLA
jgi:glucosamine--fructose-6-phosphate aminotransferase (isomerizing)